MLIFRAHRTPCLIPASLPLSQRKAELVESKKQLALKEDALRNYENMMSKANTKKHEDDEKVSLPADVVAAPAPPTNIRPSLLCRRGLRSRN